MNKFLRRNYDASKWAVQSREPGRYCDYCWDLLEDGKCVSMLCPKDGHFRDCDYPGEECVCSKIQKELDGEAEDKAVGAEIADRHEESD